ncbi:replication protein A 70 kDa DNA-binding subunit B [Tanacetum coccineum]
MDSSQANSTTFGLKYKIIVRVIDNIGSASLFLFNDMIDKLVGIPCYKLKEKYGSNAEDIFPEELTNNIVGKRLLFRFTYTEYNINNNNHVYRVKMMSNDDEFIALHKKDFIHELQYQDSLPFNIEETPKSKGKEIMGSNVVIAGNGNEHAANSAAGVSGGFDKGKRTVIDLDEYDKEEASAKRSKKPMMAVKIEKP